MMAEVFVAGAHVVNIWLCDVSRLSDAVAAALPWQIDEAERRRNERFVIAGPRLLHAAAHTLIRVAIARRLGSTPAQIRFGRAATGKPFLVEPASTLTFNITHGGSLAVCAVADGYPIGIDVEPVDRPELTPALLEGLLAPCEAERLQGLAGSPLQEALVALWTGKEAIAKAHGGGLSLPLASFAVPEGDGPVTMSGVPGATPPIWRLHRLRPDRRHRLALALALPPAAPLEICIADAASIFGELAVRGQGAGSV